MATERPASSAVLDTSIASVVLPVPTSPYSHSPRPSSRRWSRLRRYVRTTCTDAAGISVIDGRSKDTPRYLRGIALDSPRARRSPTIRPRHRQGAAPRAPPATPPPPPRSRPRARAGPPPPRLVVDHHAAAVADAEGAGPRHAHPAWCESPRKRGNSHQAG